MVRIKWSFIIFYPINTHNLLLSPIKHTFILINLLVNLRCWASGCCTGSRSATTLGGSACRFEQLTILGFVKLTAEHLDQLLDFRCLFEQALINSSVFLLLLLLQLHVILIHVLLLHLPRFRLHFLFLLPCLVLRVHTLLLNLLAGL
jgi:hypothetical protein